MKAIHYIFNYRFLLSAAGLTTGCSDDVPIAPPSSQTATITFNVSDEWLDGTRTLISDANAMEAESFSVLGKYSSGSTYNANSLATVFDNQTVGYSDEDGWTYEPKKNWTRSSTYRFCAYWPTLSGVTLSGDMANELLLEGFSLANEPASQTDLLLSSIVERTTPGSFATEPDGITINFHHLLCNVRFAIKKSTNTSATIVVTNIRLNNVKNTGTYTATNFTDLADFWQTGSWSNLSGAGAYNSGQLSQTITTSYAQIENWDAFLAIPQSVNTVTGSTPITLRVEYTSTPSGGTVTTRRVELPLPASTTETAWQANKRITYQLEIGEDNTIKFGLPTVKPWGTAQASGTIVIK